MSERRKRLSPFSGIDGESYTVDGDHRYVLLMDSSGSHVFAPEGLTSKACFEFLLNLPSNKLYVAFGLNYDVNMMLVDFGRERLRELWRDGECLWFTYKIEWIPGKWFKIREGKRSIRIDETFGFFQTSFIKALAKWQIETQDVQSLETMKSSRSVFDDAMRDRIVEYCHTETLLLNRLMEAVRESTDSVGLTVRRWNGAGAIAASILRKYNVKESIVRHEDLTSEVQYAVLKAYFGGRTELFKQGLFSRIWQYDIVSAYPHAAISLPSLVGGRWIRTARYDPSREFAIWHVVWKARGSSSLISPFPYRYKHTRICYPSNGEGWYQAPEVRAATQAGSSDIRVLEGWVFHPATDDRPFSFVPELAAAKVAYKREGHGGEKILKLGLNAMYGKTAQGRGYKDSTPPFQSFFWAGYMTARTRAKMFELANVAPQTVVMIATDGIFYAADPHLPSDDTLGSVERTLLTDCFTAQPGVYRAFKDGEEIRKSRGFFAREIDFDQLQNGFESDGSYFKACYSSTRFIGVGTGLMSKSMDKWRTWHTSERNLSLYPSTKRVLDPDARPVVHLPPDLPEPALPSEPYTPKGQGYKDDEDDSVQGKEQPLRS